MVRDGLRPLGVVLLVCVGGQTVGCQYEQLRQDNEALWTQNQELQEELARSRLALDAMVGERDKHLVQLDQDQAKPNVILTGAAANTGTGFGQIQGVEAIRGTDRVTVRVPGDVLFDPGKASLKKSARQTLQQIADVIKRQYPGNTIHVQGFTDTDPIKKSKWTDNLELSLQRAAAVHRYLQEQGIDPVKMQAVGKGPWHPRDTKAHSRRVEIVVSLDG